METSNLQDILEGFNAPINEEQTWAVCYQCANFLRHEWNKSHCFTFAKLQCIELSKDGTVSKINPSSDSKLAKSEYELVRSLGLLLFQALDYGLSDAEEQTLSPTLEALLDRMIGDDATGSGDDGETDEGIEDAGGEEEENHRTSLAHVIKSCCDHLQSAVVEASSHYKAVCRALVTESIELITFLEKISTDKAKLKSKDQELEEGATLEELQKADWARLWMQVMRELRTGVRLKKKDCVQLSPVEYELTPYEVMMKDIRAKKHNLKQVTMNEDIPQRTKKDAHDIILEFIRSRPPLHPAKDRKLSEAPLRALDVREMLLQEIRGTPRLKPTPGGNRTLETSRTKLNPEDEGSPLPPKKIIKPDMNLLDFDNSDSSLSDSEDDLEDRNRVSPCPFSPITPLSPPKTEYTNSNWRQIVPQQYHELFGKTSRSYSTSISPTSSSRPAVKTPPCLRSRKARNSIAVCESPTYTSSPTSPNSNFGTGSDSYNSNTATTKRPTLLQRGESLLRKLPPTIERRLNQLNAGDGGSGDSSPSATLQSSLECLSLTVEEVMHIRNVLTKSELESLLVDPKLHALVSKGKVCFTCLKTKFSLFGPWSTQCKFCKRHVCSKCISKMRIPTEHFESIPVYTLSPSPPGQEIRTDLMVHEKTGSAPNSPEFSRKTSSFTTPSSGSNVSTATNTPMSTNTPESQHSHSSHVINHNNNNEDVANGLLKGQPPVARSRKVGRAATMRYPAGGGSAASAALQQARQAVLQGPMMHLCKDCKGMVVNIIKSSRSTLAQAPQIRKESMEPRSMVNGGGGGSNSGSVASPLGGVSYSSGGRARGVLSRSSSLCSGSSGVRSPGGVRSPVGGVLRSPGGIRSPVGLVRSPTAAVTKPMIRRDFHLDLKPVYKAK